MLPAWGDDVEQPVARAEHGADGDPVELASYVPALVVRRFADRHEPLAEAETEQFLAAVLFADIPVSRRLPSGWLEPGQGVSRSSQRC